MQKRLPLPAGTVLQNRYRILRQLGRGGMGVVYEAADDELGLSFALKETFADDEAMRQAFKREARMLASVSHEAFPRVTHYFTEMEGCFLVMELIRGDDLDSLLSKQSKPFAPEQVLKWADQILDALDDLHSQGIVHRDIKPSNLKLTPRGKIKLLDFGIAKGALGSETTAITTFGSLAAATLQYAPLEQVLRASFEWYEALSVNFPEKTLEVLQNGTDARSDLYALGATLYQLLTNKLPVNAPTRALTVWAGKSDKQIPAHEINFQVSKSLSFVLQKAMEIDRRQRPASAAEMRQMLHDAASTKIAIVPPAPETKPSEPPKQTFFSAPKSAVTQESNKSGGNRIFVDFDAPASPAIQPAFFSSQPKRQPGLNKILWLILPVIILLLGGALGMWRLQSSEETPEKVPKVENNERNGTVETKIQQPENTPATRLTNQLSNSVKAESRNAPQPQPQSTLAAKPTEPPQTETKPAINPSQKTEPQRAAQVTTVNRQTERTQPRQTPKPEVKQNNKTNKKKKSGDCIFTDDCN